MKDKYDNFLNSVIAWQDGKLELDLELTRRMTMFQYHQ